MLVNSFLRSVERLYGFFITIGSNLQSVFLLYMRLTWGHQFFITGLGKLSNIGKVTEFFTTLGIAYPEFHAYAIAFIETIGGILLIIGFASRLIAIPLIAIMVTALTLAHAESLSGFRFVTNPPMLVLEQPYPFLMTALLVFIFGPGRVSLDGWIKRWIARQPRF